MAHYRGSVRDLEFNLFEVFEVQRHLGAGPFREADEASVRAVLRALDELAAGPLADSFVEGDRNPPVFDPATHTVTVNPRLKDAYALLMEGGWHRLALPPELGGFGFPPSVQWAAAEVLLTANPALYMYFSSVPNAAAILHRNGTAEQRRWAGFMVERGWAATMVITEPDAGSDVGAARTRAVLQDDGSWHVEGVKRFITGGEHDLTENIMHLVLARPEGPGVPSRGGTKGLSLFLVPKLFFDPVTGAPAGRNGVQATALEEKMGLRASATCELTFGAHGTPARGWLLGDVHNGIAQMFQAIEWARMTVGTKGIGTLSSGYRHALEHARTRVQGADLRHLTDKAAPRVPIIAHPDVRRSLMTQKAYAEGMRAVYLYAATFQDRVALGTDGAAAVNDLLLPVVKGVGSERAYEQLAQSLQVLGGSGYLTDYPIEQYLRDSKIDSLYEGTTAIQSLDFFFRKVVRDGGQALRVIAGEIEEFLGVEGNGRLKVERELLRKATDDVQAMVVQLTTFLIDAQSEPREIYKVGQHSVRLLMSFGDLLAGWLLLRQAEVALVALGAEQPAAEQLGAEQPAAEQLGAGQPAAEEAFYTGKVAVASFFAKVVLPELSARRAVLESCDNTLMEVPEDAF